MRDDLWKRVEDALDARRSPFDDHELAAELRARPADERAVQRLLVNLERFERGQGTRSWPTLLAAGLVAASIGAFAVLRFGSDGTPETKAANAISMVIENRKAPPPRLARVELAPRRVLAWTHEGATP